MTVNPPEQSRQPSQKKEENPESASEPVEGDIAVSAPISEQTILELYRNPKLYQGRQVAFIGMILQDEQLKQHFGDRDPWRELLRLDQHLCKLLA